MLESMGKWEYNHYKPNERKNSMTNKIIFENKETDSYMIFNEDHYELKPRNTCESYGSHGQVCGCYDAGCYSIDNCDSGFKANLESAVMKQFDLEEFDYDYDLKDSSEEIKEFVKKFIEEQSVHTENKYYTYWDGHNWKSVFLDGENGAEWEENEDLEVVEGSRESLEGEMDHSINLRNKETGEVFIVSISRYAWDYSYTLVDSGD